MIKSLAMIERQVELIHQELRIVTADPELVDKSHELLRQALLDSIALRRKIEEAHGWQTTANKE